eukprot:PhM_4_TR14412/c0_g1_i1/m.72324
MNIVLPQELKKPFTALRSLPISYIGYVMKTNRTNKRQLRVIVVACGYVFNCDTNGDIRRSIALPSITSIEVGEGRVVLLRVGGEYDMLVASDEAECLVDAMLGECPTISVEHVTQIQSSTARLQKPPGFVQRTPSIVVVGHPVAFPETSDLAMLETTINGMLARSSAGNSAKGHKPDPVSDAVARTHTMVVDDDDDPAESEAASSLVDRSIFEPEERSRTQSHGEVPPVLQNNIKYAVAPSTEATAAPAKMETKAVTPPTAALAPPPQISVQQQLPKTDNNLPMSGLVITQSSNNNNASADRRVAALEEELRVMRETAETYRRTLMSEREHHAGVINAVKSEVRDLKSSLQQSEAQREQLQMLLKARDAEWKWLRERFLARGNTPTSHYGGSPRPSPPRPSADANSVPTTRPSMFSPPSQAVADTSTPDVFSPPREGFRPTVML